MTAQLQPIDLVAPGFRGLNLSQSSSILSPEYCTKADNCVIDASGRLAARDGYTNQTTTAISTGESVKTIFEYREGDGTRSLIVSWDGGISTAIDDPEGGDISGSVTDTDGYWWFQNYNDKVVGFIDGQKPIVYDGSGTFATVSESAGTAPTVFDGIGLAAYGRIWAVDSDGVTIKYCDLLDETAWSGAGTGAIDMSNIWTAGTDTIRALAAFNTLLVIFGTNHIVFMGDSTGSELGVDPDNLYVTDIITGTGCTSQRSIQPVGESDLLFLSRNGIQSLARVIIQKSNPITNLSKTVRSELLGDAAALSSPNAVSSVYDPVRGFYLLTFSGTGRTWCLDQRYPYADDQGDRLSIVTTWSLAPTAWVIRDSGDLLLGTTAEVGLYGGNSDDGNTFRFVYQSPWLDLGEQLANRLKILKRIGSVLFVQDESTIVFKWATDFESEFSSLSKTVMGDGGSEYGVAEFGEGEFSGGLSLRILRVNARDTGQYYRLAVEGDITGTFALQQLELFAKIGRLA